MGGKVPRECFMTDVKPTPRQEMETFTIIGGIGGKKTIKVKVDSIDSVLRWEDLSMQFSF